MGISKANAVWNGGLKDGQGVMKPAHAAEAPFSLGTRFEGKPGTNPEEMVGAALAGCFSMALSLGLELAGKKPQSIETSAKVHLDKDGDGFSISKIELTTEVKVADLDDAAFQEIALATKKGCPVSKALAGTSIELTARLA
ncbi:MAG TPA: OsmC family peroxiredoxin [Polyangiaceae bacterium]|nr:OsmC family peroxiredoxin [Polyangiaceae bacterium]